MPTIPVEQESAQKPDAPTVLDDIIVTATKRPTASREVPGSISALSGESLEEQGAREQEDFLGAVPGVSLVKEEPNRSRVTIRGIAADNGTSQAAGILIDDVPFTDPFVADLSPDLSPFDLENVEVMKGPQGTLFGASGLAGAIRYVLRPAQLGEWEAHGFANGAAVSHGQRVPTYGAAVNVPVGDELAFRAVGTVWERPGVIDETGRGEKDVDRSRQLSYRALGRYAPSDRLDVRATHLVQRTSTADLGFVDQPGGALSRNSTPTPSPIESDFTLDQLTAKYDFDSMGVTSVSSRMGKDLDINADTSRATPGSRQFAHATVDGVTQELRFASPPDRGPWRWLVGGFYMHYDTFRRVEVVTTSGASGSPAGTGAFVPVATSPALGNSGKVAQFDLDAVAGELALFGETTYRFFDRIDATIGARGYRTKSDGVATSSGALNVALTGSPESQNEGHLKDEGVSPKVALQYRFTQDVSAYALASRGFRFGGIALIGKTVADDIPPTYKSDHVDLYEAGTRTQWLQRTLVADAAVYRMNWTDPQLTQLTQSGTLLYIDNVGAARVNGAEATLRYLTPLPGFAVAAVAGWTDARTSVPFKASSGTNVAPDARWPFTSNRQWAAEASYTAEFGSVSVAPSISYRYTGPGYSNIENTEAVFDYSTVDAHVRVGLDRVFGIPSLVVSATNLTDERGVASNTLSSGTRTIYYIRPRTVSAELELRF